MRRFRFDTPPDDSDYEPVIEWIQAIYRYRRFHRKGLDHRHPLIGKCLISEEEDESDTSVLAYGVYLVIAVQVIPGGVDKLWLSAVDSSDPGDLIMIQETIGGKDSSFKFTDQTTAYFVNKKGLEGHIGTHDKSDINKAALEAYANYKAALIKPGAKSKTASARSPAKDASKPTDKSGPSPSRMKTRSSKKKSSKRDQAATNSNQIPMSNKKLRQMGKRARAANASLISEEVINDAIGESVCAFSASFIHYIHNCVYIQFVLFFAYIYLPRYIPFPLTSVLTIFCAYI